MNTRARPTDGTLPSISETLGRRAVDEPTGLAYIFLDDRGQETSSLTYSQLDARARDLAAALSRSCRPGDRALLAFPAGLEFLVGFFGCLYAGVIAVPVQPPRRRRLHKYIGRVAADARPTAVLTLSDSVGALDAALPPTTPEGPLRRLVVDPVGDAGTETKGPPTDVPVEAPSPNSLAFLQYTSGSTSSPKGVMVTHGNLVANEEMIRRSFGHDRSTTVVGWAPMFHDQGLIGNALQPLHVGSSAVLMSPTTFVRRPMLWLSTISSYGAHTSGGPNFAYELCTRRATAEEVRNLDLSCWKVAFNGAEPIRTSTLEHFTERFSSVGFRATSHYPCYGLAEATLIVSGSGAGRGPRFVEVDADALGGGRWVSPPVGRRQRIVGAGQVLPGQDVSITDPVTGQPVPPGLIGEIRIRGPHVAHGYWQDPAATRAAFGDGSDPQLRTGDLGVVVDGELFVVGRLKDVMVIRGRNVYPQDVEQTIEAAHPRLRNGCSAAFAVEHAGESQVVVVAEVQRDHGGPDDEVVTAARGAVVKEHETLVCDVVLVGPGRVPKTSSGKIMRSATREGYLRGEFGSRSERASVEA